MPDQVTYYYVERCPECRQARDTLSHLLNERGVDLQVREVESDLLAREQMIRISAQASVPVIVVDKREIVGVDPRRIRRYLGLEAVPEHRAHW